jgi:stearoyl-CoA desaturase (delta-9 desaturase)
MSDIALPTADSIAQPILPRAAESMESAALDRVDWKTAVPILSMHVMAVVGLFFFPITLKAMVLVAFMYYWRMWALSTFFHRYFSHRSFKTSRGFQFAIAILGSLTLQNSVLWWAANHRHHHRFSDQPEDLHSPTQKGFWWAHMGWIISYRSNPTRFELVKDLAKYPELMWLHRNWLYVDLAAGALFLLIMGPAYFFWGCIFATVVLYHGTFTINSLAHVWGKRRYVTTDTSRNNPLLALITAGEGWHNNHHHYMSSARLGFEWWQFDPGFYSLKLFEKLGLVWDVREPPERVRLGA